MKFVGDTAVTMELEREPARVSNAERDSALAFFHEMAGSLAGAIGCLLIGAPNDDDRAADAGAVYVFTRLGGDTWAQTSKLGAQLQGLIGALPVERKGNGHPLQRHWRDLHGARQHAINEYERVATLYGQVLLGNDVPAQPMF